jgi:hypothetical protein
VPFVWLYFGALGTSCLLEIRRAWLTARSFDWMRVVTDVVVVTAIIGLGVASSLFIS